MKRDFWRDPWRDVLRRFAATSTAERLFISVAALAFSLVVGAGVVLVAGWLATCGEAATIDLTLFGTTATVTLSAFGEPICYDPVNVYVTLFTGAFGDFFADPTNFSFSLTLKETTLLVFSGLSVAIAVRGGMFNIGTQGQLVLGALASAIATVTVAPILPGGIVGAVVVIPFALAVGAVVGGLYGALPGALKAYADANEVITTIMLNFIAAQVAFYLTKYHFQNPESQVVQTRSIPGFAQLQPIFFGQGSGFSLLALVLGLALAGGAWLLLERTSLGYDLRTSGLQPDAAEYGGVDAEKTMVTSMALSGALAGIGGAVWVLMAVGNYQVGVPSYGFDGITVSILAGNNPLGVPVAALLFGVLKSGSLAVQFAGGVPQELSGVLRGLIILFVAMPEFFRMLGKRLPTTEREKSAPVATDGGEGGEGE